MRLTKHHGLGNDFLVTLGDVPSGADLARRLCDRHRGVGADGLIVGRPPAPGDTDVDVVMDLRNADGSVAEMSGNGIRCLAQAFLLARGQRAGRVRVATAAGPRPVHVSATNEPATCMASVSMGAITAGDGLPEALPAGLAGWMTGITRAETADAGNPHLVVQVIDPTDVDLEAEGPRLEAHFPRGVNIEFIAPTPGAADELDLRVWERGVGITEACGTGATSAATLAHRWGLVGHEVVVHQPGGDVTVIVGDEATLVGPSTYIGSIEVLDG